MSAKTGHQSTTIFSKNNAFGQSGLQQQALTHEPKIKPDKQEATIPVHESYEIKTSHSLKINPQAPATSINTTVDSPQKQERTCQQATRDIPLGPKPTCYTPLGVMMAIACVAAGIVVLCTFATGNIIPVAASLIGLGIVFCMATILCHQHWRAMTNTQFREFLWALAYIKQAPSYARKVWPNARQLFEETYHPADGITPDNTLKNGFFWVENLYRNNHILLNDAACPCPADAEKIDFAIKLCGKMGNAKMDANFFEFAYALAQKISRDWTCNLSSEAIAHYCHRSMLCTYLNSHAHILAFVSSILTPTMDAQQRTEICDILFNARNPKSDDRPFVLFWVEKLSKYPFTETDDESRIKTLKQLCYFYHHNPVTQDIMSVAVHMLPAAATIEDIIEFSTQLRHPYPDIEVSFDSLTLRTDSIFSQNLARLKARYLDIQQRFPIPRVLIKKCMKILSAKILLDKVSFEQMLMERRAGKHSDMLH